MPTPSGLPKPGERWQRTYRLPPDWKPQTFQFDVLERSRGDYWSARVRVVGESQSRLFVDIAYWFSQDELKFVSKTPLIGAQ